MKSCQGLRRKPHRIKKKKSIFRRRFFWLGILILVCAGSLVWFATFSSVFQIKYIHITGNEKVSAQSLQEIIQNQINKKILFFQTKSIFLANSSQISQLVLERFPQIAKIDFKKKFPDKLALAIEERRPVAIFCSVPSEEEHPACFFINKEGILFEKTTENGSLPFLKIQNLILPKKMHLGDRAIEKELLSQALEIEARLKENFKILIKRVSIASNERLNIKTSQGWEIYINPKADIDWQLTKLNLVLEKKIPPEKREELDYIELRFGNRAYHKYK